MNKRLLIFALIIILSFVVFLKLTIEKQKTSNTNSLVELNFKRKIIDSFIPKKSQEIQLLNQSVYRTSLRGDTLFFLTEGNVLYSFKDGKLIQQKKILSKCEYWYINIGNGDTSYFDKNNNLYYNTKTKQRIIFNNAILAIQEIDDSTLLLHRVEGDIAYLAIYDLKKQIEIRKINLLANLDNDKQVKINSDQSLAFGEFSKNSNYIYYTFFNAGYVVKYNIKMNDFFFYRTKDSLLLPTLIEKKVPVSGTIRTFTAFSHEFTNISTTISNKYLYILSNVTTAKEYNFIDIYDIESMSYLYSIKVLASSNKLAYQINFVNNKIYLVYGNEKVYIQNISL